MSHSPSVLQRDFPLLQRHKVHREGKSLEDLCGLYACAVGD
jgi:hypothetical protein